jgi:hypothetical protein
MNQMTDVKSILRRTATDGTEVPTGFAYESARQGVGHVLSQIENQVLAQRMVFDFDDGTRLACISSGRRLVRLLEPAPRNLHPNKVVLFVQEEVTADDLDTVVDLLIELCERGRHFTIVTEPSDAGLDPSQGGVSTSAIAERLDLAKANDRKLASSDDLPVFIERIDESMLAGVLVQDESIAVLKGDGEEATRMIAWANRLLVGLLSPSFPGLATLESSGLIVFGLSGPAERHLLVAGRLGSFFVAAVEGRDVAASLAIWREVTEG